MTQPDHDPRWKPVWVLSEGDVATIYNGLYGPDDGDGDEWAFWLTIPQDTRDLLIEAASDAIGYVWADAVESAVSNHPYTPPESERERFTYTRSKE